MYPLTRFQTILIKPLKITVFDGCRTTGFIEQKGTLTSILVFSVANDRSGGNNLSFATNCSANNPASPSTMYWKTSMGPIESPEGIRFNARGPGKRNEAGRLLLVVDEDPECRGPSAPDLRSSLLHFTGISIYFESEAREPGHKSRLAILVASNLAHFVACHSTVTNLTPLVVWWPASILQHATSTIFASIDTEEWLKDFQLCILGPIMCRVAGFLSRRHQPMQSPWAVTVV